MILERSGHEIKTITIHCSASDNPSHDNIETIREWHTLPPPKGRGWDDVGYHYFITKDGKLEYGRGLNEVPASAKGHNKDTIAICLSGLNDFVDEQFEVCARICSRLRSIYNISKVNIFPHNHFNPNKACPNFDIHSKIIPLIKP